jgi:hypothetical protein
LEEGDKSFIEMKIREKEALKALDAIDRVLSGAEASKEPA